MRYLFLLLLMLAGSRAFAQRVDSTRITTAESDSTALRQASMDSVRTRAEYDSAQAYSPQALADKDSAKKQPYWGRPQRAALYSAILPGAGQVYNKEIWKVPIIYAGLGVLTYFWISNAKEYNFYNHVLINRADSVANKITPQTYWRNKYNTTQLIQLRDFYRRNRDFTIILTAITYLLQIADAHVFAHLKGFNVDDNLSIQPAAIPMSGYAGIVRPVSPGLSLTWKLR